MPIINPSTFHPPLLLTNGHVQTFYPILFRKVTGIVYKREHISTPDNDFMELDWSCVGGDRVVIILHGLEGHSKRKYMYGMAYACNIRKWDTVCMNFRGCSGEPNRLLRSYHHGSSDDLHIVVSHVLEKNRYNSISLVGFSLGANVVLKYLGEHIFNISPRITTAVAISAPCDLTSCALKLAKRSNFLYMKRFLSMLHQKIRAKMEILPGEIDDKDYHTIRTFKEFDDRYTAPIHGFKNAEDYWEKCSSKQFLHDISIPTLILNALNDPFLTEKCVPQKEAEQNKELFLETPISGGHVAFVTFGNSGEYWHETRTVEFLENLS